MTERATHAPAEAADVGGSHVKMLLNGDHEPRRFVSAKKLTVDGQTP